MRLAERTALAQEVIYDAPDGACKELAAEWGRWEGAYAATQVRAARWAALSEPVRICAGCSIVVECAQIAALTHYTGFAAGQPYINGRRVPPGQWQPAGGVESSGTRRDK